MAEILVQVSDLAQLSSLVAEDFLHGKRSTDNGDYKITVEDFANTLKNFLELGNLAYLDTVNNSYWQGADLSVGNGGTGASDVANARTNLGVYSKTEADARFLNVANAVPIGGIIMWSGNIASIPSNWALADGTNGTPDLTDKFIIGASADDSGVAKTAITGSPTKTGGSKDAVVVQHNHSATANEAGSHTHTFNTETGNTGNVSSFKDGSFTVNQGGNPNAPTVGYTPTTAAAGTHNHSVSVNQFGETGTNKNLPPYYALAYIMRIA